MELRPISVKHASAFVTEHHRHHDAPQGAKFALAAWHAQFALKEMRVQRHGENVTTLDLCRACAAEVFEFAHAVQPTKEDQ